MSKNNKVCDFCLSEASGMFSRHEKTADGHYICKNCKAIIQSYGLPVKYDLFQTLVTAQPNMKDMIMDTWLENHKAANALAKFYPLPQILLHDGEHCLNAVKAVYNVKKESVPQEFAVKSIADIRKGPFRTLKIHRKDQDQKRSKACCMKRKQPSIFYRIRSSMFIA
jgi:hypothetical protein